MKAVHTLYVRCYNRQPEEWNLGKSLTRIIFSDFPLLPLYLRCELGAKVASLLDPQSKLVRFLRFHTAVSADDLVPCVQAALFMWVFLSPGTDMLPSVSSVPLSSWKHRSPSRPLCLASLNFSQPLLIPENRKVCGLGL